MLRFRLPLILTFQAVVACFSLLGAFLLRFDFNIPPNELTLVLFGPSGRAVFANGWLSLL